MTSGMLRTASSKAASSRSSSRCRPICTKTSPARPTFGWLTSAGYGYTVGLGIGYGYVRNADGVDRTFLESGSYELEVATRRVPCAIALRALYDAEQRRIRC